MELFGRCCGESFADSGSDYEVGNREAIIVSEIPYMVNKAEMIKKTADLINAKKLISKLKSLKISNLRGFFSIPVAETALAGILSLKRGIYRLSSLKEKKKWLGSRIRPTLNLLNGSNVLILGAGSIGSKIKTLLEKFNCKIYFYVNKKLLHLFKDCPFNVVSDLNNIKSINYYQYLISLQRIYFKENNSFYKNINYINSNEKLDYSWKQKISKFQKPTIAINWQGNPNYTEDHLRSIPLKYFEKIFYNQKYNFISLQKGFGTNQIKQSNYSKHVVDLSESIDLESNIFVDTISILKSVDLLITSDTALAHLAGTMEINTYLILNYNPEWRWTIENNKKCFYSEKLRILKQKKLNDWQSVFDDLSKKIENIRLT